MTPSITRLDQVLAYIARGWRVLPLHYPMLDEDDELVCSCRSQDCTSVGKHPLSRLVEHGLKDATVAEALIREWYEAEPDCGWAIATGRESGLVGLDVDPRAGGDESLRDLEARYGPLPRTPIVLTGGGGNHYYFRHPGGHISNSSGKLGPGLDLKADGGYLVCPPSVHQMKRAYRWDVAARFDEVDLADPPDWLIASQRESSGYTVYTGAAPLPEHILEGEGRDNGLTSLAGSMRNRGASEAAIFAALRVDNDERCIPPLSERDLRRIAHSIGTKPVGSLPFDPPLEAAAPAERKLPDFPIEHMPLILQEFGAQGALTLDAMPELVIGPMLAFASAAIGTTRRIRLNADWTETALIWLGIVGDPGMKKTPAIGLAGRPYHEWHRDEMRRFKQEWSEYKEALGKRRPAGEAPPLPPQRRQRLVDDTTMEALSLVFQDDGHGIILDRDELTGFVGSMNQYKTKGTGSDRSNWLSIWSGRHITINRKGDPNPIYVEWPFVSLVGGIQPEKLSSLRGDGDNDGFLDRFLFCVIQETPAQAAHDSFMEEETVLKWREILRSILHNEVSQVIPLSTKAKNLWMRYSERHAAERNAKDLDPIFKGFWSKAEGTALRLALVFYEISYAAGYTDDREIDEASVRAAWELLAYFKETTRYVYTQIETTAEEKLVTRLMAYIEGHSDGNSITARELQQGKVTGIATASAAEEALKTLENHGRGWCEVQPTHGGRRVIFHVGERPE